MDKTLFFLTCLALLSIAIPAFAAEWETTEVRFSDLDTNGDGVLSNNEFKTNYQFTDSMFEQADTDDDNEISRVELAGWGSANNMIKETDDNNAFPNTRLVGDSNDSDDDSADNNNTIEPAASSDAEKEKGPWIKQQAPSDTKSKTGTSESTATGSTAP